MKGDVAGVVVNYNAREHLLNCVASLLGEGVEIVIVADNGSVDGSEAALSARYPEVKWAETGSNLGYGAAADLGAALSDSTYLLVCNPDVVLGDGCVATLRHFLEARPDVAVVGPRIVDGRGALYPSARRFPDLLEALGHGFLGQFWPGNPFSRRYRMNDWDHCSARTVDWVSGACFLVRRSAWEVVGGFDRAYFMYLEDVDLCWRLGGGLRTCSSGGPRPRRVGRPPPLPHVARPSRVHVAFRPARHTRGPALGAAPGPARPGRPSRPHGGASRPGWPTVTGPARAGARRKVTW